MPIFEEITLTWKGEEFKIPPDQVMKVLAKVEDVITMVQLHRHRENGDLPLVKISQAYGIALRHAGAHVKDEEIYNEIFAGDSVRAIALNAVLTLQMMMIPPAALRKGEQQPAAGKPAEVPKKA